MFVLRSIARLHLGRKELRHSAVTALTAWVSYDSRRPATQRARTRSLLFVQRVRHFLVLFQRRQRGGGKLFQLIRHLRLL